MDYGGTSILFSPNRERCVSIFVYDHLYIAVSQYIGWAPPRDTKRTPEEAIPCLMQGLRSDSDLIEACNRIECRNMWIRIYRRSFVQGGECCVVSSFAFSLCAHPVLWVVDPSGGRPGVISTVACACRTHTRVVGPFRSLLRCGFRRDGQ